MRWFALFSPILLIRFSVLTSFHPMTLQNARVPFSRPNWFFELKYDGFRALAHVKDGAATLVSRNGNPFASFADLAHSIAAALPNIKEAVLDGEIVCLDKKGRPRFNDLLFRRSAPCFFAFDLLHDGRDRRNDALVDRKSALRLMIGRSSPESRLQYADHVEEVGMELFQLVCKLDMEGVVAKPKYSPYEREEARSSWYKIKNRGYSQMVGRHDFFEQERHREPVPGWHSCALACSDVREAS
jgi:bifunctional non-homologous end joining protein LigD